MIFILCQSSNAADKINMKRTLFKLKSNSVITLLILALYPIYGFGQSALEDVAKQYSSATFESSEKVMLAGKYAQALFFNNRQDEAYELLTYNIAIAKRKKDGQYAAYLSAIAAMNSLILDEGEKSQQYIQQAKHYVTLTDNMSIKGYVNYCIGWLQVRDGQEARAVQSFQHALNDLERAPISETTLSRKVAVYKELCAIYSNWKEFPLQQKYAELSLDVAKSRKDPMALFDAYMLMGYMHERQYRENKSDKNILQGAERYYLEAIRTYESNSNKMVIPSDLSFVAVNLANLYMEFFPDSHKSKALKYAQMAMDIGKETHQYDHVASAYGILSEYSLKENDQDQAKTYLLASLSAIMNQPIVDQGLSMNLFQKLSEIYEDEEDYKQAIHYYKQYLRVFEEVYNSEKMLQGKRLEEQFEKERQKQLMKQLQLEGEKKQQQLSLMQALSGQQTQLLENMRLNEKNQQQQLEFVQLEAEKKGQELKLSRLETLKRANELFASKQQLDYKSKINTFYFLTICATLISAILLFYAYRQRSKTLKQKESLHELEMEQEKQNSKISNLTAMLEGQENERSRLARDLHDGLGGLLSGTKICLSNVNHRTNPKEIQIQLDKSLNQIDFAVHELRRVAHNLMPELLLKYGLQETIQEYVNRMSSERLEVSAQFVNLKTELPHDKQILVYRIIQELVNNALKHANAHQIIVQLAENDQHIFVTVEDDGDGFATEILDQKKSAGIHNVKTRLSLLNGQLNIQTQEKVGTTIEFDFPVDAKI